MMDQAPSRLEIAIKVYDEIYRAIANLEEKHRIYCDLPEFIDIDGERFFKRQLLHMDKK